MRGCLPVVGHTLSLHRGAVAELLRASREQGPIVRVNIGVDRYLFCFGSEAFELLKHKSVAVGGARPSLDFILGKSLLAMDGAAHKSVRTAMNPSFSPRGIAEAATERVINETIARAAGAFVAGGGGEVRERMQAMALDVIFRVVGVEVASLSAWRAHYRRLFWGLVPIPFEWPGTPRYFALRAAVWINRELQALLDRAREAPGDTLVHTLVRTRDEEGRLLTDRELIDNLRLLFVAGHETTASTLTWATVHLAERPDLMARLHDEVAGAGLGDCLSIADSKKLPLCEGVFREAVRLYTPAWFIERRVTADVTYRGKLIPSGTTIAVCPPEWARDPALYPDPDRFEPDRWLGRKAGPTPVELSSFGGGAHFCLGYHLSWLESIVYIARLAQALGASKKRLRLSGDRAPSVRYFPFPHPSPAAHVDVI